MNVFGGFKPHSNDKSLAASPVHAHRVLIVEDEPDLSAALTEKLTSAGFSVAQASNGQIGLDTAVTFKPEVILLDLMMPVMDGKTMLRKLRELPQFEKLPVIVLTNAGSVDNMTDTKLYNGAVDFLIKSNVDLDKVVTKINSFLPIS